MSTVNALVAAARDGDVGQIKALAKQCDINARDEIGWCAVHRAAVHGQVASLRCLVANGADLDAVDDDGWRAIHRAAWVGDCPTLTALVELGAGVETACDATGETAVHVAARNGRLKALRCLATELGANVAARDAFGRTAAHFAAWEGHVHMLRSLKSLGDLARDADDGGDALLVARDRDGRLPVDYADDRGARDAAAWLRALAARKSARGRGAAATVGARRRSRRRRRRKNTGAEDRDVGVRRGPRRRPRGPRRREVRRCRHRHPAGCRRARPRRADGVPARRRAPAHRPKGRRARGAPRRGARLCHFRGAARPGPLDDLEALGPYGLTCRERSSRSGGNGGVAARSRSSRGHRARDGGAGAKEGAPPCRGPASRARLAAPWWLLVDRGVLGVGQVVDAREQDEEERAGRRRREGRAVRSVAGITRMTSVTRARAALLQADLCVHWVAEDYAHRRQSGQREDRQRREGAKVVRMRPRNMAAKQTAILEWP